MHLSCFFCIMGNLRKEIVSQHKVGHSLILPLLKKSDALRVTIAFVSFHHFLDFLKNKFIPVFVFSKCNIFVD